MKADLTNYQVIKIDFDASVLNNGLNQIGLSIHTGTQIEEKQGQKKLVIRFHVQYLCHNNKQNIFSTTIVVEFSNLDDYKIDIENGSIDHMIMEKAYQKVSECISSMVNIVNINLPPLPEFEDFISS